MQAAERRFEILKFLSERHFGLRMATTEFLNFTPAPSRNGFRILKFTLEPLRNRFEILKFTLALARLADTAQNFISQHGFKILKPVCEPLRALHRVLPNADKAEAGRGCSIEGKRRAVKFNHAGGYSNFVRRRIARLRSAAARHGYEARRAGKFSKFSLTSVLLNFISLPPHKFKPASAVRLNFALNSVPPARAVKFENGVKFKGVAKFKRDAR